MMTTNHKSVARVTHTNIGIYKSVLDGKTLTKRERLKLLVAIENYMRPRYKDDEELVEWQIEALKRHHKKMEDKAKHWLESGLWIDELGYFDDFCREVTLETIDVVNFKRPD